MREMVERVARALCLSKRNSPTGYPEGWLERHVNEWWPQFIDDAKIAIAAMREPTESMLRMAVRYGDSEGYGSMSEGDAEAAWQSMIDEALK